MAHQPMLNLTSLKVMNQKDPFMLQSKELQMVNFLVGELTNKLLAIRTFLKRSMCKGLSLNLMLSQLPLLAMQNKRGDFSPLYTFNIYTRVRV